MPITGLEAEIKKLNDAVTALERQGCTELLDGAKEALETAMANTPVWSGEAVANYHVGASRSEGHVEPIGDRHPKEHTSKLAMGAESQRPANEEQARQSLVRGTRGIKDKLPQEGLEVYSTLSDEKADLIDNGAAPTPGTARNKGGVMKLAEQAVRTRGSGAWK